MPDQAENFLVLAAMRDEGAFIVEWVTWYRMLGFRVLIAHNDCTDHSPDLIAALARAGWVEGFEHHPGDLWPKASAHRAARAHPAVAQADWLLICDVDEFLVPHVGDGTIGSYLDHIGRDHGGVAFHWRCFGTGGQRDYRDALIHRSFTRCGPGGMGINANIKTMFRDPLRYHRFDDHAPTRRDGQPGTGGVTFVDGEGRPIPEFQTTTRPVRRTDPAAISHRYAQMNHYILRWSETFALKRGRPSASAGVDRYTDRFFKRADRADRRDLSATAFAGRFDQLHARAMALPGVSHLHHLCCADHTARICALVGGAPEGDPRWRYHMAEAGRSR